ncbi:hypothetical protein C8J57DRAFT_1216857 [Mycena rebaudengoi]|nr:hypothetical protein C8J57DRAFT_1216857 [Mycena rebaudengoi]
MSLATFADPLNLLPPELAGRLQLAVYIAVGSAAIFIWDILHNLKAEYTILFKRRLNWTVFAYCASRLGSFAYVIGFVFFATLPVGRCLTADITINSFYTVGLSATCLLFFFRVRAIYSNSRSITIIFGLLWLAVLGASITVPIGAGAVHLGPTNYCLITEVAPYVGASSILVTVHDTAVFFAISYRLMANSYVAHPTSRDRFGAFISGAYLPAFSKALFIDGQVYYMISVVSNIVVAVMVYAPALDPVQHGILALPNAMLTSVMACRVYRNARLGLLTESGNVPSSEESGISVRFTPPRSREGTTTMEAIGNKDGVLVPMSPTSYVGKQFTDCPEAHKETV